MSASKGMHIAVVGGGIAGLALALNLHARGIGVRVYEGAPTIREMGVGITLLPHGMREIAALGLEEKIAALGIENRDSIFFNRFGQRIHAEPRGRFAGYPFPEIGIHRGRLHMLLYNEVIERLGAEAVVTDRRCTGLEQDARGVTLYFQDAAGTVLDPVHAEAAVACDGINSAIRRQFYPDEAVQYTGINTWRGVTRTKPILGGRTYMRIGSIKSGKMVIYPIVDQADGQGDQLVNWVAELQSTTAAPNDWNQTASASSIPPVFDDWKFDWLDVPSLIQQADVIFEYPMVDKDPIQRWTFDRVTFAGDAAHPMYPRGSNGSAQALIDVRVLADLLAQTGDAPQAFERFQDARLETTAKIVHTNRATPPDIINIRVEELTDDKPFDDLSMFITPEELQALSDSYKAVAGFGLQDVTR